MNPAVQDSLPDRLVQAGILDAAARDRLARQVATPWWLSALLAVAAWIASLLIMGSFFGPLLALGEGPVARFIGGVMLLGLALWLLRRNQPFLDQMGLAFSLAGQGLVAFSLAGEASAWPRSGNTLAFTSLVLASLMLWPRAAPAHRVVCALIAVLALAYLVGPGVGLAFYGLALAGVAVVLWLGRPRWAALPAAPRIKALAHAATLGALVLAPYGNDHAALDLAMRLVQDPRHAYVPQLYAGGALLLGVATAAWLSRSLALPLRGAVLAAAVLLGLAAHSAPGLVIAASLLPAVFQAGHRAWVGLTLGFGLLYLGELYYSLHVTLLAKSVALMASGALLLLLAWGLGRLAGAAGFGDVAEEDRP